MKHFAVIPARAGSVGLPGKNRMFFANTADFLESVPWFDERVVSTDDTVVRKMALDRKFRVIDRPADLAGPDVSIKPVLEHVVESLKLPDDAVLWLFYLPVLHKDREDFEIARREIEQTSIGSLCTFVPAKTHPYDCWSYNEGQGELQKFLQNDVFRRQDKPTAWAHYHYVCCLRVGVLPCLNNELIAPNTHPQFLDAETAEKLVEIDTPGDLERWQRLQTMTSAD
jgi:CMP-N-acetylneuraminic acid synthetase